MLRSPQLQSFLDEVSISLFNISHSEAGARSICVRCTKSIHPTSLNSKELAEWKCSRLCPTCYDALVGPEN